MYDTRDHEFRSNHSSGSDDEDEESKLDYCTTNLIVDQNINVSNVRIEDVTTWTVETLMNELVKK